MRLAISVSKAQEHRVEERSTDNFLNSVEDVKQYATDYDVSFFVNIRGQKAEKGVKPLTFKEAYVKALALVNEGYSKHDVFISAVLNEIASPEDIDF